MSSRFRVNSPPVVAETLDGETTIVDLDSGTYYALNPSGSFIWDELVRGTEPEWIAAEMSRRYGVAAGDAGRDVDALVSELRERNLIAPLGADASPPASPENNGTGDSASGNGLYAAPQLSTYTDMQELLLLDPVHEVDEAGWPSTP
jgi:outer membrane protein assembly factor BamB